MKEILLMSAGVAVWALHFGAIYGLTALACARGWHALVFPSIAGATALAVAAAFAILLFGWRRRTQFEAAMSAGIAAFALLAIIWQAIPVLMLPVCT